MDTPVDGLARMRIALVSQEYPPETAKGGIGTQTHTKAHGLAALGHEVVILSRHPGQGTIATREGLVSIIRIGLDHPRTCHTEMSDWVTHSMEVAGELVRLHEERPFDVVDFPEWAAEGFVHLINRSAWNHIPTVIHLHGPLVMLAHALGWPPVDSEFYRTGTLLEGTCLRLADALVASSRCSLDWCARHYGLATDGVPIIHTGIDTAKFRPLAVPPPERPTILFAGRLAPSKGVFVLLEAALLLAAEFPRLRVRLLGRGDADTLEKLTERAREAGQADLLDLAGFVPREQLVEEFSRAHVFAAPSLYEGGPCFANLEAMACGMPVVACTGSGAVENIRDGETGFLVPPDDPVALAATLRRLLHDPGLRERVGQAAREYTIAAADTGACMRRLEAFYRSVVVRFPTPGVRAA